MAVESQALGELATPLAFEMIIQYFDAEHAPDAGHGRLSRAFHGCVGNHGSLSGIQARAPFIAAGPIRSRGVVPEHLRTVDVADNAAFSDSRPTGSTAGQGAAWREAGGPGR